jgi:hypothetical protein
MKPGALPPTPPLMKQPGAPAIAPGGPVKPPAIAPGKPPVVAPGKPPVVAPGKPPVVAPGKPPVVAPGKPPVVAPGKPPVVAPGKPPVVLAPPIAPPRVFVGPKRVRTYPDGRKVIISRGKAVTIYPNGQKVIMRRGPMGRMIKTTVKPGRRRVIKRRKTRPVGRPIAPPRVFVGPKRVRTYPDGRKVIISRGKAVTIYPNGQKVIMKRGPMGRMIKTTVHPSGQKVIQIGKKTITVQPDGRRVIVTRGILGKTRTVVKGPQRRRR